MLTFFSSSIYSPLLVVAIALILAHLVARLCFFSYLSRADRLFAAGQWLPLRFHDSPESGTFKSSFEQIEFSTCDGLTLRGSYFQSTSPQKQGVILYFHEMNGNRWSISPYVDAVCGAGFDLLTFDQRGHGESDAFAKFHQTPWITTHDLDDVKAAVDYLHKRQNFRDSNENIGVFGLGKGATLALCCASRDDRVKAVVMDAPAQEGQIYKKNCLTAFAKAFPALAMRKFSLFAKLLAKSFVCIVAYPFIKLFTVWQRFMMSLWCRGTFVNAWPMIKKMDKPILILYNTTDPEFGSNSFVSLPQIHAFRQRMSVRPKICIFNDSDASNEESLKMFARKITAFFTETFTPGRVLERTQDDSELTDDTKNVPVVISGRIAQFRSSQNVVLASTARSYP